MANKFNPLFGKKVIVFGGSSGIGFGVAEILLDRSAIVFIGSSSAAKVEQAVSDLKKTFPQAQVSGKAVDLTSEEATLEFVDWVAATGNKGIDHIAYTAGDAAALAAGKLEVTKINDLKVHQDVRYWGVLRVVKAAQRHFNTGASLTITSGTVAIVPPKGWMVAAGMGAGVVGLARGLAVDCSPLRVNCVVPGAILTPLWDSIGSPEVKKQVLDTSSEKTLTKTVGSPLDCAFAYLYLMQSTFATGSHVVIDGGSTISRD